MTNLSRKYWLLIFMTSIFLLSCEDSDPAPAVVPILLDDEILGNWEFETGELYELGHHESSLTTRPREDCSVSGDPLSWLIRPIDVQILTDHRYITLIMTECLERSVQYTHLISYNDYRLTVVDSTLQSSGNPIYPFKWRVRTVSETQLTMWRIAPDAAKDAGVEGARMLYTFKRIDR